MLKKWLQYLALEEFLNIFFVILLNAFKVAISETDPSNLSNHPNIKCNQRWLIPSQWII